MRYFKLTIIFISSFVFFMNSKLTHAQFLESLFGNIQRSENGVSRDDLLSPENTGDELTFEEVICRDIDTFPKISFSKNFQSYSECISKLDQIQSASYIDLTYRIRWDNDRIDLYLTGTREIYICDGSKFTKYEHQERKDPDWWMIVRNSPELLNCAQAITVETID